MKAQGEVQHESTAIYNSILPRRHPLAVARFNVVQAYGMATWDCFRKPVEEGGLQLQRVVQLAESVGGKNHGFR